jgi:hypothetical protein
MLGRCPGARACRSGRAAGSRRAGRLPWPQRGQASPFLPMLVTRPSVTITSGLSTDLPLATSSRRAALTASTWAAPGGAGAPHTGHEQSDRGQSRELEPLTHYDPSPCKLERGDASMAGASRRASVGDDLARALQDSWARWAALRWALRSSAEVQTFTGKWLPVGISLRQTTPSFFLSTLGRWRGARRWTSAGPWVGREPDGPTQTSPRPRTGSRRRTRKDA